MPDEETVTEYMLTATGFGTTEIKLMTNLDSVRRRIGDYLSKGYTINQLKLTAREVRRLVFEERELDVRRVL